MKHTPHEILVSGSRTFKNEDSAEVLKAFRQMQKDLDAKVSKFLAKNAHMKSEVSKQKVEVQVRVGVIKSPTSKSPEEVRSTTPRMGRGRSGG